MCFSFVLVDVQNVILAQCNPWFTSTSDGTLVAIIFKIICVFLGGSLQSCLVNTQIISRGLVLQVPVAPKSYWYPTPWRAVLDERRIVLTNPTRFISRTVPSLALGGWNTQKFVESILSSNPW